jgi:type I restriction enzyme R subunit
MDQRLDRAALVLCQDVDLGGGGFIKKRKKQSVLDHQAMNAALDPAVSRFVVLQRDEESEAEELRGKLQGFRNLYGFLSQVIPYQDSDLERLYVFLRHLASKLPRRKAGTAYQFDDEVQLEYYRLQKISEGSISLREGTGARLDGTTAVIDVVNERFGTDFNQADQLFFDQIIEAAMADDGLRQAAAVNPSDKFELVFKHLLERLFMERMDQNEEIFVRYMNDAPFQRVVMNWMASEAYRRLRSEPLSNNSAVAIEHSSEGH